MKNKYIEMKHRQEMDYNDLIKSATNEIEFKAMLKEFGLSEDDAEAVINIGDNNYIRRSDLPVFRAIGEKHIQERNELIKEDERGDGFVYQMFLKELNRFNYGYTGEVYKVLNYLGITMNDVRNNPALSHGFNLAISNF